MHRSERLQKLADAYVKDCFSRETPPHVNEFAQQLGMPVTRLSELFRAETGERPSKYFKRAQVARAIVLLRTTRLPLNQVGYKSGFGTRVSFYRAFRRATGHTPASLRHK